MRKYSFALVVILSFLVITGCSSVKQLAGSVAESQLFLVDNEQTCVLSNGEKVCTKHNADTSGSSGSGSDRNVSSGDGDSSVGDFDNDIITGSNGIGGGDWDHGDIFFHTWFEDNLQETTTNTNTDNMERVALTESSLRMKLVDTTSVSGSHLVDSLQGVARTMVKSSKSRFGLSFGAGNEVVLGLASRVALDGYAGAVAAAGDSKARALVQTGLVSAISIDSGNEYSLTAVVAVKKENISGVRADLESRGFQIEDIIDGDAFSVVVSTTRISSDFAVDFSVGPLRGAVLDGAFIFESL